MTMKLNSLLRNAPVRSRISTTMACEESRPLLSYETILAIAFAATGDATVTRNRPNGVGGIVIRYVPAERRTTVKPLPVLIVASARTQPATKKGPVPAGPAGPIGPIGPCSPCGPIPPGGPTGP